MSIHQSITDPHEPTPAALAARERVMAGQFTRADAEALMASCATGDYHLGLRVHQALTREENEARRVPVHRFVGPADSWRSNIGGPPYPEPDDGPMTWVDYAVLAAALAVGLAVYGWLILSLARWLT